MTVYYFLCGVLVKVAGSCQGRGWPDPERAAGRQAGRLATHTHTHHSPVGCWPRRGKVVVRPGREVRR